jgi:hypothetical protein
VQRRSTALGWSTQTIFNLINDFQLVMRFPLLEKSENHELLVLCWKRAREQKKVLRCFVGNYVKCLSWARVPRRKKSDKNILFNDERAES